jgi:hypothetical protein
MAFTDPSAPWNDSDPSTPLTAARLKASIAALAKLAEEGLGASTAEIEALSEALADLDVSGVVYAADIRDKVLAASVPLSAEAESSDVKWATIALLCTLLNARTTKSAARLATAAALPTNVYANGTSGVGATLTATANGVLTVDGTTVALGDRVLVTEEAEGKKNGLYKCTTEGTAGAKYVLTRVPEMDQTGEFVGATVLIVTGTAWGGVELRCTNTAAVTVGTTAVTFGRLTRKTISFNVPMNFIVAGEIKVPEEQTNAIPPAFVSLLSGQTAKLVECRAIIGSGTKVTFKLTKNGTEITGFTGLTAKTTAEGVTPTAVAVADHDLLAIVVTAVEGTPKNLTVELVLEQTVA